MADGMKVTKFKVNKRGLIAFLQSEDVMSALKPFAENIGKIESQYVGFDRAHVVVKEKKK